MTEQTLKDAMMQEQISYIVEVCEIGKGLLIKIIDRLLYKRADKKVVDFDFAYIAVENEELFPSHVSMLLC